MASPSSPGIVDLTITIANTSPGALTVAVSNALGVLQSTFSPGSSPPLVGVSGDDYAVLSLDVSDHTVWPTGLISGLWTDTTPSPDVTYSKAYSFFPYALTPNDKTVVTWQPYTGGNFAGYCISRTFSGESPVIVGFSAYNTFVDNSVVANELTACIPTYQVAVLGQNNASPGSTELIVNTTINSGLVKYYRTGEDICLVTGSLLQVDGSADDGVVISAFLHDGDAPLNIGATHLLSYNEITIPVNSVGQFAVALVQGNLVTIHAPEMGYSKRFVVPAQAHINLSDIPSPMDLETELFRGE
jgi:hypothetical protein